MKGMSCVSLISYLILLLTYPALAANDAEFISQTVPSSMTVGQSYSVSVTMKNTGTTSWTAAGNYRLGSQNPQDNWNWGNNRAYLSAGDSIAPGQSKTFSFTITAPATPGTYNFQWRMLQEGIEWFGDYSQNRAISVESGSNCQVYDPSRAAYLEDSTLCADNQVCSNGICRYPEILQSFPESGR